VKILNRFTGRVLYETDKENLSGADLRSANLSGAFIETGEKWEYYISDVVNQLLVAGGKKLEEVRIKEHWYCHSWENCPLTEAFENAREKSINAIPVLLQPRAKQFLFYFDNNLIPLEYEVKEKT